MRPLQTKNLRLWRYILSAEELLKHNRCIIGVIRPCYCIPLHQTHG